MLSYCFLSRFLRIWQPVFSLSLSLPPSLPPSLSCKFLAVVVAVVTMLHLLHSIKALLRLASLVLVNKMSYKFVIFISQQNEIWTISLLLVKK
jgi:hypothetical protein